MSNCPFCNLDQTSDAAPNPPAPVPGDGKPPTSMMHRTWRTTQWLFPSLLLVLMPKCPICIAAYVALFAGIGISVSTAHWIQILMWSFCLISLAYLTLRLIPLFQRSRNVYRTSHAR